MSEIKSIDEILLETKEKNQKALQKENDRMAAHTSKFNLNENELNEAVEMEISSLLGNPDRYYKEWLAEMDATTLYSNPIQIKASSKISEKKLNNFLKAFDVENITLFLRRNKLRSSILGESFIRIEKMMGKINYSVADSGQITFIEGTEIIVNCRIIRNYLVGTYNYILQEQWQLQNEGDYIFSSNWNAQKDGKLNPLDEKALNKSNLNNFVEERVSFVPIAYFKNLDDAFNQNKGRPNLIGSEHEYKMLLKWDYRIAFDLLFVKPNVIYPTSSMKNQDDKTKLRIDALDPIKYATSDFYNGDSSGQLIAPVESFLDKINGRKHSLSLLLEQRGYKNNIDLQGKNQKSEFEVSETKLSETKFMLTKRHYEEKGIFMIIKAFIQIMKFDIDYEELSVNVEPIRAIDQTKIIDNLIKGVQNKFWSKETAISKFNNSGERENQINYEEELKKIKKESEEFNEITEDNVVNKNKNAIENNQNKINGDK